MLIKKSFRMDACKLLIFKCVSVCVYGCIIVTNAVL